MFGVVGAVIWIPLMLILIQRDWDRLGGHGADFWERFPGLCCRTSCSAQLFRLALVLADLLAAASPWAAAIGCTDNFAGSAVRKAEAVLEEVVPLRARRSR